MDKYSIGKCKRCGRFEALKNEICKACEKKQDFWDWFSDALKRK